MDSLVAFSTTIKPEAKSLYDLFLVEKIDLDPKYPSRDKNRLYIIQGILLDIIKTELCSIRQKFFIESRKPINIQVAIESIKADSVEDVTDLISWSILYYLYVHPDLGINLNQIADIINVAPRTIRRYRTHGISLLTNKLWECESDFRDEVYVNQLIHKYQIFESERFVIRENEINDVIHCIGQGIHHIYTYGEPGVGKTVFVKQCIATLIRNHDIDHVIWLDDQYSKIPILEQIQIFFRLNNQESLIGLFKVLKCIIVFDNVDIKSNLNLFKELIQPFEK